MTDSEEYTEIAIYRSIVLHGLIALALYYLLNRPTPDTQYTPIELEEVKPSAQATQKKKSEGGTISDSMNDSHAVSLKDLGMRYSSTQQAEPTDDQGIPDSTSLNQTAQDGWDLLNPDPRVARFNRYLYSTVQGWLDRDAYLNPATLTGSVKVRIWFDENGNWIEKDTQYEAIDPDFQAIVQRALRKSFANPIPKPYLFKKGRFYVDRVVVLRPY